MQISHFLLKSSNRWWNTLSLEDKQKYKKWYELQCFYNPKRKYPYTHMTDTTHVRISQLTQNQIKCIFRFKDTTV